MKRKKRSNRNK